MLKSFQNLITSHTIASKVPQLQPATCFISLKLFYIFLFMFLCVVGVGIDMCGAIGSQRCLISGAALLGSCEPPSLVSGNQCLGALKHCAIYPVPSLTF